MHTTEQLLHAHIKCSQEFFEEHIKWSEKLFEEHIKWVKSLSSVDAEDGSNQPCSDERENEASVDNKSTASTNEHIHQSSTWIENHIRNSGERLQNHIKRASELFSETDSKE